MCAGASVMFHSSCLWRIPIQAAVGPEISRGSGAAGYRTQVVRWAVREGRSDHRRDSGQPRMTAVVIVVRPVMLELPLKIEAIQNQVRSR